MSAVATIAYEDMQVKHSSSKHRRHIFSGPGHIKIKSSMAAMAPHSRNRRHRIYACPSPYLTTSSVGTYKNPVALKVCTSFFAFTLS